MRHLKASERLTRQSFEGASFLSPQGEIITFTRDEYDAYQIYQQDPQYLLDLPLLPPRWEWPILSITFFTRRKLIKLETSTTFTTAEVEFLLEARQAPSLRSFY